MFKLLRGSLKRKLLDWILLSAAAAAVLFFALHAGTDYLLDHSFRMAAYINSQYTRTMQQLQDYVDAGALRMTDKPALERWVSEHKEVTLSVYHDDGLLFSSDSSDMAQAAYLTETDLGYDRVRHYTLEFSDGAADVYLFGSFDYQLYVILLAAELLAGVLLFFLLVGHGVNSVLEAVGRLEKAVTAMEGGDLDLPVPAEGQDELGRLARQLDAMRLSLSAQMETERQAREANRELVTTMSHDLRTPLTALLLYAQLLKNHTYRDAAQEQDYIDRINTRALQIKDLSDALFCHFLIDGPHRIDLQKEPVRAIFPDLLSDFICTLHARGFSCETQGTWPDAEIWVCEDYLMRILDNLLSNLLKYADRAAPVRLSYRLTEQGFCLELCSRVAAGGAPAPSSRIGLVNVAAMMQQMHGSHTGRTQDGVYTTRLLFAEAKKDGGGAGMTT